MIGVEEDREEFVSNLVDAMVATLTFEEMRNIVWDKFYEDLIWQEWADLRMYAEEYAPALVEKFG